MPDPYKITNSQISNHIGKSLLNSGKFSVPVKFWVNFDLVGKFLYKFT